MADEPAVEREVLLVGPEATEALGEALGRGAHPGLVLALEGELGAGKTSLVRGLARGLDVEEAISSPTFTLMNDYPGRLTLHHFDAWMEGRERSYLADGAVDVLDGDGVCAIEWGERVAEFLPRPYLSVQLVHRSLESRLARLRVIGEGSRLKDLAALIGGIELREGIEEVSP